MVASLASLDSSLAISVKMPIFQKQAEILFMRASFPSHAMQLVLPDHQSFLSGSLTISTGYFCIVPSLNLQHSSPPPGQSRSSGQELLKLKDGNIRLPYGEQQELGLRENGEEAHWPLLRQGPSCMPGTLDKKAPRTKWCLESSALCLADKGICLGTSNQESEQGKLPLQG